MSTGRENKSRRLIAVRLVYEMLLSLDISWLVVWYGRQRGVLSTIPILGQPLNSHISRLYMHSHMTEPQTTLDQVTWSILMGVGTFLVFQLLGQFVPTTMFLSTVGGAIAVAGLPLAGLLYPLLFLEPHSAPTPFTIDAHWLILEATAAFMCAL